MRIRLFSDTNYLNCADELQDLSTELYQLCDMNAYDLTIDMDLEDLEHLEDEIRAIADQNGGEIEF